LPFCDIVTGWGGRYVNLARVRGGIHPARLEERGVAIEERDGRYCATRTHSAKDPKKPPSQEVTDEHQAS